MSFKVYSTDDGRVLPIEYLPVSAIQPTMGMALKLTSGKLAKCGATDVPAYISMHEAAATLAADTIIPVIRVQPDVIFETTNSAALTSVAVGAKVQLNSNALQVTATTTTGVAEIVYKSGDAVDSTVHVRFNTAASA